MPIPLPMPAPRGPRSAGDCRRDGSFAEFHDARPQSFPGLVSVAMSLLLPSGFTKRTLEVVPAMILLGDAAIGWSQVCTL